MAPVSKLSDVIRKATRAEASRRLGFGTAAAPRPAPSLLCLVHLSAGDSHKVAEAVSQGADAVILDGADPGKVKDQIRKAEKAVLGVRLRGKADRSAVAAQHEAGADFVVLEPDSAAAEALLEDGLGVVLSLGRDLPDMTLRLLGDLSPDALLAPPPARRQRFDSLAERTELVHGPAVDDHAGDAGLAQSLQVRDGGRR